MAAECDHDHDGYVMGYRHAQDLLFERLEGIATEADEQIGNRHPDLHQRGRAYYMGFRDLAKILLKGLSDEREAEAADRLIDKILKEPG